MASGDVTDGAHIRQGSALNTAQGVTTSHTRISFLPRRPLDETRSLRLKRCAAAQPPGCVRNPRLLMPERRDAAFGVNRAKSLL